jgi:opacity protein-like surface antigen
MKKRFLLLLLLPCLAVAAFGQESRMEASASGSVLIPPFVAGSGNVYLHASPGYGGLLSYRYDVTPLSQLEANYSYMQDKEHFSSGSFDYHVHTRVQEISFAYVRMFNFRNFNPFIEAGGGAYIFTPIDDTQTNISVSDLKQKMSPGALYGVGFAYELSPSWDLRVEYRGIIMKTPTFGYQNFDTRRYYNVNDPVIGFAYHF